MSRIQKLRLLSKEFDKEYANVPFGRMPSFYDFVAKRAPELLECHTNEFSRELVMRALKDYDRKYLASKVAEDIPKATAFVTAYVERHNNPTKSQERRANRKYKLAAAAAVAAEDLSRIPFYADLIWAEVDVDEERAIKAAAKQELLKKARRISGREKRDNPGIARSNAEVYRALRRRKTS